MAERKMRVAVSAHQARVATVILLMTEEDTLIDIPKREEKIRVKCLVLTKVMYFSNSCMPLLPLSAF